MQILESSLSKKIHQIDMISDDLYITDTQYNTIKVYHNFLHCAKNKKFRITEATFNNKCYTSDDQNHLHINSIYKNKNEIYFLAHNMTENTKKESQAYVLDEDLNLKKIVDLNTGSGHNFYIDKDNFITNDSLSKKIIVNDNEVKVSGFSRGLSVSEKYILIGSSNFEKSRKQRLKMTGDSEIYVLDHDLNFVSIFVIPGHQIIDIRGVDYTDFCFSNVVQDLGYKIKNNTVKK